MRIAIISDSHGNLTALDAVLNELDREGPFDRVLFGGDIAYGGPFPSECIDQVLQRGYAAVRGNTDQMILDAIDSSGDAHGHWVAERLDTRHVEFLRDLPVQVDLDLGNGLSLALVHATPWSIYDSVLPEHGRATFGRMVDEAGVQHLTYGHIHVQHYQDLGDRSVTAVGSLGLPFDGDQRAMYTVIESGPNGVIVDFERLAYDVEKAISEAESSDGPNCPGFATNLRTAQRPG
jgi:predicted phosphodiesterase